MTTLVVGATGKTGRSLVQQLLDRNHKVRMIVRTADKLSPAISEHPNTSVFQASILDLTDAQLAERAEGCEAIVSCLGHVMSFSGIFGSPRKLCTDAVHRLCEAIEKNNPQQPVKFILMSTVAVPNPDLDEKRPWHERLLLRLLHYTLPPHSDNESAAAYLHRAVGKQNKYIAWCSVRPDALIDADISPYEITPSPITGIVSGRPTARSNVAHFMAALIEDAALWNAWQFTMPVIMGPAATSPAPGA